MVHSTFFYAKKGGSQFLADALAKDVDITYNVDVSNIRGHKGQWYVEERAFDRVVYTGNIRHLPPCLNKGEILAPFDEKIKGLRSHGTTTVLCSIDSNAYSWIYLPSQKHASHRIICTGNFSPANNGEGLTTATIEFSEQLAEDEIREQLKLIPFNPVYLAHHWEEYTYPVQDMQSRGLIQQLKDCLEPQGFYLLGRFAEWEYYNIDAAIGAALDLANRL